MLYIIATPIGNLEDITLRALSTLKAVDYILCEDTRRTKKLLLHYEIPTRTFSFHNFNEKRKEDSVIADLHQGKKIALVSDAGMPTISDPGAMLIQRCHKESLAITCIPGPSSVVTALALSGFIGTSFQFLGFFPKKNKEIEQAVETSLSFTGISIFFVSPHRLLKTLKRLPETMHVSLAKELTKIHETLFQGTASMVYTTLKEQSIRGEYVLLLSQR